MCSVDVEDGVEDMLPKTSGPCVLPRSCMKCSENAIIVVRANDPLCRKCFLAMFNHKFRATIGKARVVYDKEKTLVAISGGASSSAMLNELCLGIDPVSKRKLRFVPTLVYVDEGIILGLTQKDSEEISRKIEGIFDKSTIPYYLVKLEQIFDLDSLPTNKKNQGNITPLHCHHESLTQRLKSLLESSRTLTAKEDLLKLLRKQLLLEMAKQEGFTKVMVGNSATRTSITMLSNIAQGRGGALPYDVTFADKRFDENIMFLRPMREFPIKEIAIYNRLNNIDPLFIPTFTTKANSFASIDKLTEEFVAGLQAGFHSTVSTIFRTGDKLAIAEKSISDRKCSLCHVPIRDSKCDFQLEASGCSDENKEEDCCSDCDSSCKSTLNSFNFNMDQLSNTVCYGCSLTVKDLKCQTDHFPSCLKQSAVEEMKRNKIREQIQEFLIDDEAEN